MKCLSSSASSSPSTAEPETKRRKVKYETYKHWVTEYIRECQTASLLDCEVETVACKRYSRGQKNISNFVPFPFETSFIYSWNSFRSVAFR
jgi:hypothetical protein